MIKLKYKDLFYILELGEAMNLEDVRKLIPSIFEKVKRDVEKEIGRHRAGLSLSLPEWGMYNGNFVGGMFISGGTMIFMNLAPIKIMLEEHSDEIVWAYIYHILLHEYLHSLGFLNERQCRAITLEISKKVFEDPKHPAIILANKGIGSFFPNLRLIYEPLDVNWQQNLKGIEDFDRGSHQSFYI